MTRVRIIKVGSLYKLQAKLFFRWRTPPSFTHWTEYAFDKWRPIARASYLTADDAEYEAHRFKEHFNPSKVEVVKEV